MPRTDKKRNGIFLAADIVLILATLLVPLISTATVNEIYFVSGLIKYAVFTVFWCGVFFYSCVSSAAALRKYAIVYWGFTGAVFLCYGACVLLGIDLSGMGGSIPLTLVYITAIYFCGPFMALSSYSPALASGASVQASGANLTALAITTLATTAVFLIIFVLGGHLSVRLKPKSDDAFYPDGE